MSRPGGIHWVAPTTMLAALLAGIAFAVGHHGFYASRDGKTVPTEPYHFAGHSLSHQQFNTSVGTALALFVRTLLALAVSTAYMQLFWSRMKRARLPPTLKQLDWASEVHSAFGLFDLKTGYRYPSLLLLALVFWCVPIGTIFPPATLSVVSSPVLLNSMVQVPHFDFANLKYAASIVNGAPITENLTTWAWTGPNERVVQIAETVMGLGQILTIKAPAANSSWSLDLSIPTLQCSDIVGDEQDAIWTNIWNSYYIPNSSLVPPKDKFGDYTFNTFFTPPSGGIDPYNFLSWVPWDQETVPYTAAPLDYVNSTLPFILGAPAVGPPASTLATGASASLFVAVMPEMQKLMFTDEGFSSDNVDLEPGFVWASNDSDHRRACVYHNVTTTSEAFTCVETNNTNSTWTPSQAFAGATLLQCDLINASYTALFNYSSGVQAITITNSTTEEPSVLVPEYYFMGPQYSYPANASLFSGLDCTALMGNFSAEDDSLPCIWDVDAIRLISYQGIMDAFNQMIVGSIVGMNANSSIMKTVLSETEEMAFASSSSTDAPISGGVPDDGFNTAILPDLQTYFAQSGSPIFQTVVNATETGSRGDLRSTLEQLFQNFTISLLSDPYFLPDYSSPFAPSPLANVSIYEGYRNSYVYDATTLWIAYGIAILLATIAVVAGMVVLYMDGVSYSKNFSTVVRVARTAELSVEIEEKDGSGCDPMPQYLKHARLDLGAGTATTEGYHLARLASEEDRLAVDRSAKGPSVHLEKAQKAHSDTG